MNTSLGRAGEQLADIEASTSEDLYWYIVFILLYVFAKIIYFSSNYSNKYLVTSENFSEYLSAENNSSWKRRPRKHHRRKPYVPSTISSVSESRLFVWSSFFNNYIDFILVTRFHA